MVGPEGKSLHDKPCRNGTLCGKREMAASQPALLAWLTRQVPGMPSKAYRWVAEMEEIAGFVGEDPAAALMFTDAARLYDRLAADLTGEQREIAAIEAFCRRSS